MGGGGRGWDQGYVVGGEVLRVVLVTVGRNDDQWRGRGVPIDERFIFRQVAGAVADQHGSSRRRCRRRRGRGTAGRRNHSSAIAGVAVRPFPRRDDRKMLKTWRGRRRHDRRGRCRMVRGGGGCPRRQTDQRGGEQPASGPVRRVLVGIVGGEPIEQHLRL